MAVLNNLVVNGNTRLIGKAYGGEVEVTEADINQLQAQDVKVNSGIDLYNPTSPHIRFHYGNSQNYSASIYESQSGTITISNILSVPGAANISALSANNAFFDSAEVRNDLDVKGTLTTYKFEQQIVQAVGGTIYVSPTYYPSNQMRMYVTAVDSSSVTFSIADAQSIVDLSYGGANWYARSKIKFSGKVTGNVSGESIVFASTNGTVTANMNSTVNRLSINVPCADANKHFSVSSSSLIVDTLSVMLYEIYISSENVYYPIGIYIKAYGSGNKSSYIDIYGGQSSQPTARLGLLNGLKDPEHPAQNLKINGLDVAGWGLMSDYAYLKGTIVSESGKIGGWTIGSTMLYNIPSNSAIGQDNSMFLGTAFPSTATGFGNPSIGGSNALNTWRITSGSKFGVTNDGTVYVSNIQASGGKIGGWTITSGNLSYGSIGAANGVFLIPAGSSTTVDIAGSGAINKWAITSGATFGVTTGGALYSTSGKIGGWTIGATSIYSGTDSMSSTTNGTYIGTDGFRNYKLVDTKGCYVNIADGKITANEADISGKITSSSGKIGGWTIGSSSIYSGTNSMTSTAAGTYIGTDGFRNFASANSYVNIANGKITANNVDLSGKIVATSGTIGGCTIDTGVLKIAEANISGQLSAEKINVNNDLTAFKATIGGISIGNGVGLYTNGKNTSTSTASGFLISKDGAIYLGAYNTTNKSCPFQVTSAGALTARSATIIGDITANTGKIGGTNGWTIAAQQLSSGETIGANSSMYLATKDLTATINGNSANTWRFTVGSQFGVQSTGAMYATSGKIGPWTFSDKAIYKTNATLGTSGGIYFGNNGISFSDKFIVDQDGALTATSGSIGGFTIDDSTIYYITNRGYNKNTVFFDSGNIILSTTGFSKYLFNNFDPSNFESSSRPDPTSDIMLAIGKKFAVTSSGKLYAGDIIANRAFRIHGEDYVPATNADYQPGIDFDCIRANGNKMYSTHTKVNNLFRYSNYLGTRRSLSIATNFVKEDESFDTNYNLPQVGIRIVQNTGNLSINDSITISSNSIYMNGYGYSSSGMYNNHNTVVGIQGGLYAGIDYSSDGTISSYSNGIITASTRMYSNGFRVLGYDEGLALHFQLPTSESNSTVASRPYYDVVTAKSASDLSFGNDIKPTGTHIYTTTNTAKNYVRFGISGNNWIAMPANTNKIYVKADGSIYDLGQCLEKACNAGTGTATGTVTSITAGTGLTGGTITTSGTIGLSLVNTTRSDYNSSTDSNVSGRQYRVQLDSAGKLSVNVPWKNTTYDLSSYITSSDLSDMLEEYITITDLNSSLNDYATIDSLDDYTPSNVISKLSNPVTISKNSSKTFTVGNGQVWLFICYHNNQAVCGAYIVRGSNANNSNIITLANDQYLSASISDTTLTIKNLYTGSGTVSTAVYSVKLN